LGTAITLVIFGKSIISPWLIVVYSFVFSLITLIVAFVVLIVLSYLLKEIIGNTTNFLTITSVILFYLLVFTFLGAAAGNFLYWQITALIFTVSVFAVLIAGIKIFKKIKATKKQKIVAT
jgi:hypothetical protein